MAHDTAGSEALIDAIELKESFGAARDLFLHVENEVSHDECLRGAVKENGLFEKAGAGEHHAIQLGAVLGSPGFRQDSICDAAFRELFGVGDQKLGLWVAQLVVVGLASVKAIGRQDSVDCPQLIELGEVGRFKANGAMDDELS